MFTPTEDQIRSFRLRAHHLDREYGKESILEAAGACGLQNSPPGAWEAAVRCRIPGYGREELSDLLEEKKVLLQAWSLRGAPFVFPTEEREIFLNALIPEKGEEWIYTRGIGLALDVLEMREEELLERLLRVIPGLNGRVIQGKNELDQTLAEWMERELPEEKKEAWNRPSMYGSPDRQTVGGAAVSFLLRPCSFLGQVVFGKRQGVSPSFTGTAAWLGGKMAEEIPRQADPAAARLLVRKFLRCYGPAVPDHFAAWLGCSGKQARRMWALASEEMEPVSVLGKKEFILAEDRAALDARPDFSRGLLLLSAHDPYLDQRERYFLQKDPALCRRIWRTTANPGVVVNEGRAAGIWTARKKKEKLEVEITLWEPAAEERRLRELAEEYGAFRKLELTGVKVRRE